MDLFATPVNMQLPWFYARFQTQGAKGTDALQCSWPQGLLYAFSLTPLMPRVIRIILLEGAEVLLVAPTDLVRGSHVSVNVRIPPDRISLSPGGRTTSGTSMALIGHLALEKEILRKDRFFRKVISIILVSRCPSTSCIYDATWKSFGSWCTKKSLVATSTSVPQIFEFLQDGLDAGLSINTLRRKIAALATILFCDGAATLSQHTRVHSFLKGASNLGSPPVHRYPSWDLHLVLQALTSALFELLSSTPLRLLTFKVAFLNTITSAR